MNLFTPLHRLLGQEPGPLTATMIDQAIIEQIEEAEDLDWKSELPPERNLKDGDFPKDVAAMANSGGGIIVYGVKEEQKKAIARCHAGTVDESYERTIMRIGVSAITPPVFGLKIEKLGTTDNQTLAVIVPPSTDIPHLVYQRDAFQAPIRNGPDTEWMKEPQIEAMYRSRFNARQRDNEALTNIYSQTTQGLDTEERAWLVAVAIPSQPSIQGSYPTAPETLTLFDETKRRVLQYSNRGHTHPVDIVDYWNLRPGLRSWIAPSKKPGEVMKWQDSRITIHHDGAITLATALGGFPYASDKYRPGQEIDNRTVEAAVADFTALTQVVGNARGIPEYHIQLGIESDNPIPITMLKEEISGLSTVMGSLPIHSFIPIATALQTNTSPNEYLKQIQTIALDCVNQGGIQETVLIRRKPATT